MIEYLLTFSLLGGVRIPDLLNRAQEVLGNPLIVLVMIGLAALLLRTRVK